MDYLVEYPRGRSDGRDDVLDGVAEEDGPRHGVLVGPRDVTAADLADVIL